MELTRDRLRVAFSSNSIICDIFIEAQSAKGKNLFCLLPFIDMQYLCKSYYVSIV